jgi:hypothetical protein
MGRLATLGHYDREYTTFGPRYSSYNTLIIAKATISVHLYEALAPMFKKLQRSWML